MRHVMNLLVVLALGAQLPAQPAARTSAAATSQVVAKAKEFLATLAEVQRTKVMFQFTDDAQRLRWSNLPSPMYRREGLRLAEMSAPQRAAALALLSTTLSRKGY